MAISQSNYGLKSTYNHNFYLFFLIGNMIEKMKAYAYGTVFDTITTKTFQEIEIIIPPNDIIKNFEEKIIAIMLKMLTNQQENQTLVRLRDSLLPKLMNGEVEV